ncbi:hypothetical protein ACWCRF_11565 [Streptomyces sp. NPDC002405]
MSQAVKLTPNNHTTAPNGTPIDTALVTNGLAVETADVRQLLLHVRNTAGSDKTLTVRAGDSTAAWMAAQGDMQVPIPAGQGVFVGPFDSTRFQRRDGRLHVDFTAGTTGSVVAYAAPRRF